MYTKRSIRKMFDVDMIEERQRAQQWLQGNSFCFWFNLKIIVHLSRFIHLWKPLFVACRPYVVCLLKQSVSKKVKDLVYYDISFKWTMKVSLAKLHIYTTYIHKHYLVNITTMLKVNELAVDNLCQF